MHEMPKLQNDKTDRESAGNKKSDAAPAKAKFSFQKTIFRYALVIAGFFFTGLGILGIFLPLLPTTPFLLLAAVCYGKSSRKFHRWLFNNRWLGVYIRNYHEKTGVSLRVKIISITFLWITIGYSVFYIIDALYGKIILVLIAAAVTVYLIALKALKHSGEANTDFD